MNEKNTTLTEELKVLKEKKGRNYFSYYVCREGFRNIVEKGELLKFKEKLFELEGNNRKFNRIVKNYSEDSFS